MTGGPGNGNSNSNANNPSAVEQLVALRDAGRLSCARGSPIARHAGPAACLRERASVRPGGHPIDAAPQETADEDDATNLPKQDTVVTCMETLNKVGNEPDSVSSLVIGTESQKVLILDPSATQIVCSVDLPSVPAFLAVTGEFDVEWRIVVACRDGKLYTITNGEVRGKAVVRKPVIEVGGWVGGWVRCAVWLIMRFVHSSARHSFCSIALQCMRYESYQVTFFSHFFVRKLVNGDLFMYLFYVCI